MSDLKLEGKLIAIFDKQQVTDSFSKREFVIETDDQYPQVIKFEFTQNACDKLDGFKIGDLVGVHFNVRGRKWTNKDGKDTYFVTLNAWMIKRLSAGADNSPSQDVPPIDMGAADDLPF